jgi:hypothetical protein
VAPSPAAMKVRRLSRAPMALVLVTGAQGRRVYLSTLTQGPVARYGLTGFRRGR